MAGPGTNPTPPPGSIGLSENDALKRLQEMAAQNGSQSAVGGTGLSESDALKRLQEMSGQPVMPTSPAAAAQPAQGGGGFFGKVGDVLGGAAGIARAVVPQAVRDVLGANLNTATSLKTFGDMISGTPNPLHGFHPQLNTSRNYPGAQLGSAGFAKVSSLPGGQILAPALDFGLSPASFLGTGAIGAGKLAAVALPAADAARAPEIGLGARLGGEAVTQTAAAGAAVAAAEAQKGLADRGVPVVGSGVAKLAVPLVSAIIAGKVANAGLERAGLKPVIEPYVEKAAVQAVLPEGAPVLEGVPTPTRIVTPNMPFEERVANVGVSPGAGDALDHMRLVNEGLAIDPTKLMDERFGKAYAAQQQQALAGANKAEGIAQRVFDSKGVGRDIFNEWDPKTSTVQLANGARTNIYDLLDSADVTKFKLTPEETAAWYDARRAVGEINQMLADSGFKAAEGWLSWKDISFHRDVLGRVVDNVELKNIGKTNPFLARVIENAAEAAARGVEYNSPRESLRLYAESAYALQSEKDLATYLEAIDPGSLDTRSVTSVDITKARVPGLFEQKMAAAGELKSAVGKFSTASERLKALQAAKVAAVQAVNQGLASPVLGAGDEFSSTVADILNNEYRWSTQNLAHNTNIVQQLSSDIKTTESEVANLKAAKMSVAESLDKLRKQWNTESKISQSASWAPGHLFGYTNLDQVPVGKWKQRFVLKTVTQNGKAVERSAYEDLAKWVDTASGLPKPEARTARWITDIINLLRSAGATGDMAAPFIQGLVTMGYAPAKWAYATWLHTKAFFDPAVQAKYVRDNYEVLQEMTNNGVQIGESELMDVARHSGPISSKIKAVATVGGQYNVPGRMIKSLYGRFQAQYETFNTVLRTELYKSVSSAMAPEEAGRFVNYMTGGVDPRMLTVTPNRRAIEAMYLAFSPRLFRSTIALVANAAVPTSAAGQESLVALSRLASVATGMYVLTGYAMGKSEKEIQHGLDPTSGRRFLSHEINGNWVGYGGTVRSIAQLVAKLATNPKSITSTDVFQNPLMGFYLGRSAPGLNFGMAAMEAATGLDTMPYENLNGPLSFFKDYLAPGLLPFSLQQVGQMSAIHSEDRIPGTPISKSALTSLPIQFAGLRDTGFTATDFKDAQAAALTNGKITKFSDLPGLQQQVITAKYKDTLDAYAGQGSKKSIKYSAEKQAIVTEQHTAEQGAAQGLTGGTVDLASFRNAVDTANQARVIKELEAARALGITFKDDPTDVLQQFYNIRNSVEQQYGAYDPTIADQMEADFMKSLTPDQQKIITDRAQFQHDPSVQWYYDAKKVITDAGYWQAQDQAFQRYAGFAAAATGGKAQDYRQLQSYVQTQPPALAARAKQIQGLIDTMTSKQRTALRLRSPELDSALVKVYGLTPVRLQKRP